MVPHSFGKSCTTQETFSLSAWNQLHETESQWRQRVRYEFDAYLNQWATVFAKDLEREIASGKLTALPQIRGDVLLETRYEWAAKRHCLRLGFKEMATDEHSADKIRKAVNPILVELDLKKRK